MPETPHSKFIKDRCHTRRSGLKLTLALTTIFFAVLAFGLIIALTSLRGTMYYHDNEVQSLLKGIFGANVRLVMIAIIKCFDKFLIWAIPGALTVFLAVKKDRRNILALVLSIGGGAILISYLKRAFHGWSRALQIIDRGGDPFPSGHAFYAMVIFGFLIYVALEHPAGKRLQGLILSFSLLSVLLIGFSLVALGHHWLAEVLAGYCAGYSWLLLSILLTNASKIL